VLRTQHSDGYVLLQSKFEVAPTVQLRLMAAPEREPSDLLFELQTRDPDGSKWSACDVRAMANLVRLELPATTHVRQGSNSALRMSLPALALLELIHAEKASLRVCADVFPLSADARQRLLVFLVAFIEERRWNEEPGSGLAHSERSEPARSRWTATIVSKLPSVTSRALSAEELYKRLSPSVFRVSACAVHLTEARCQPIGSAVAVSQKHLVTNAHVSGDHEILLIEGEGRRLEAQVVALDQPTDRAVLQVVTTGEDLIPVPGVRDFASLQVGEPAFAIGSPKGYDDTFSNGVVSALRPRFQLVMGGVSDCVQTSAAISHGSSGGGLFDKRGNLIGITTEAVPPDAGQNLNFAIAADAFFRP
jgi:S1-C subfamily serine protease